MFTKGFLCCFESSPTKLAMTALLLVVSLWTAIEVGATSECSSGNSDNQWTVQTTVTFTPPMINKDTTEDKVCTSRQRRAEKAVPADRLVGNYFHPWSFPRRRGYATHREALASRETTTEKIQMATVPSSTENGYQLFEGLGYYKLHTNKKAWSEANQTCVDEGGHLVIINSEEEEMVLKSIVKYRVGIYDFVFIGINDIEEEGNFMTVLGEPFSSVGYANWADGEPNNAYPGEDCGSMRTSGKINDFFCEAERSFLCEIPLDSFNDDILVSQIDTW